MPKIIVYVPKRKTFHHSCVSYLFLLPTGYFLAIAKADISMVDHFLANVFRQ